jgi:hypothetical protein
MDLFSDHSASDMLNNGILLLLHPDKEAPPSPITLTPPAIAADFLRNFRRVPIIPPPFIIRLRSIVSIHLRAIEYNYLLINK